MPSVEESLSVEDALRQLEEQKAELARLRRAQALDLEQVDRIRRIADVWKPAAIAAHIRSVVAAAPVHTDPFPHMVLEPLLPPDAFECFAMPCRQRSSSRARSISICGVSGCPPPSSRCFRA